jgi:hypothetical protein
MDVACEEVSGEWNFRITVWRSSLMELEWLLLGSYWMICSRARDVTLAHGEIIKVKERCSDWDERLVEVEG